MPKYIIERNIEGAGDRTGNSGATASNTISATFGASITQPTQGKISLTLPASTTNGMKFGRYVYDVEITSSGGTVSRVIEGQVEVMPGVTR